MKIILASQSPNRKRLLKKAGFVFEVFEPNIEEKQYIVSQKPKISCLNIAKQKALKAQAVYKKEIIIACDQMVYWNGEIFGKAHSVEKARECLNKLQGQTHTLFTGLFMFWEEKEYSYLCESKMTMRKLSDTQIQNYISNEKPLKCAGSYHIESEGIQLFEKIETEDFNAIEGLPLIQVINQLSRWGWPLLAC